MYEVVKLSLFVAVMIYASVVDYKKQIVYNRTYIMLFLIGIINVDMSSFVGMAIVFIPLFVSGLIFGGIGGGDIKIAAMCGFVLKTEAALVGIGVGLLLGAIIPILYRMVKKRHELNSAVPLVPFLTAGTIIINLLILLKGR